jgi:hypothetical protein
LKNYLQNMKQTKRRNGVETHEESWKTERWQN